MANPLPLDIRALDELIKRRVTRATFHENGALASVDFVAQESESQHEAPAAQTSRHPARSVGRLVPRAVGDST